uniref:Putative secreted protein n=1 Tax=Anopheles marajoara TaxID=58244 RepID=A0A2M4C6K5_9DIPT
MVCWQQREELMSLGLLLGLLGQQHGLDVGQDTALRDGHSRQQLVQLLVVTDGQLQMTRDDTRLLVVSGGVTGQLEYFSGQVLHDGRQIDGSASTDALGVVALPQQTMDTADRELQTSAVGTGLCLSLHLSSLSTARHDECG